MKTVLLTGLILLLTIPCFAELTTQEEADVKLLLAQKQVLIDIAKTLNLEKIPLQIAVLKSEREALIATRNGLLKDEDIKNQAAKQLILTNYEGQIDAKDSAISSLNSQLNP